MLCGQKHMGQFDLKVTSRGLSFNDPADFMGTSGGIKKPGSEIIW